MKIVVLDPGHGGSKCQRICEQCQSVFLIYKSQANRGQGKFCSKSCCTKYRNTYNNPSQRADVREKISKNHADVSGKNNPMYGRRGSSAPSYIDGRSNIKGDLWRRIALVNKKKICEICKTESEENSKLHVHHKDKNRENNDLSNLQVVCVRCHNMVLHKRFRNELGQFKEVMPNVGN